MNKQKVFERIDQKKDLFYKLSDDIWDTPELGFHEETAAKLQIEALKRLGFTDIKTDLAGMPTAFSAAFGSGRPVIAFMGEFDALSGLSQTAGVAEHKPLVTEGSGHGCGRFGRGAGGGFGSRIVGSGLLPAGGNEERYHKQRG